VSRPYSFEEEFGTIAEDAEDEDQDQSSSVDNITAAADRAMANMATPESEEDPDADADYMGEVDKRLEVTSYYRELLRAPLFGVTTEAARIVEREVRRFVQNRLEVLLGMRKSDEPVAVAPPPPPLPFTDLQVTALQVWANKLLQKPEVAPVTAPAPKPEPQVRPAAAPPPKPTVPVVNRQIPQGSKPAAKPAVKPAQPQPVAKAEPKPEQPKQKKVSKAKSDNAPPGKKTVVDPETGEERLLTVEKGQVRPTHMKRGLTPQELAAITEQQAQQALSAAMSAQDPLVASLTAEALNSR